MRHDPGKWKSYYFWCCWREHWWEDFGMSRLRAGCKGTVIYFFPSLSFFFIEDRKINENNSYKTEPILGLFWSLWIFTVIRCFSADVSQHGMKWWIWQRVGQRPMRWLNRYRCLLPRLVTWVCSPGFTCWKERTPESCPLISLYALCQGVSVAAPSKQMFLPLLVHELWYNFPLP